MIRGLLLVVLYILYLVAAAFFILFWQAIVLAGDRSERVSMLTPLLASMSVSVVVLVAYDWFDVTGGAILLMIPALFLFIPGDILSASMFELADGRVTSGSAQFVYSGFLILLLATLTPAHHFGVLTAATMFIASVICWVTASPT